MGEEGREETEGKERERAEAKAASRIAISSSLTISIGILGTLLLSSLLSLSWVDLTLESEGVSAMWMIQQLRGRKWPMKSPRLMEKLAWREKMMMFSAFLFRILFDPNFSVLISMFLYLKKVLQK